MKKSDREIMEILEAFDATGCANSAASLAGVDPKTVRRYVAKRDAGKPVDEPVQRPKLIDPFLPKIEELVETSEGGVRADVVHERLVAMGFTGDERTTRRAVATVKGAYAAGHRRRYRPWITEPGLWLQFDWGAGPIVFGADGRPRPTLENRPMRAKDALVNKSGRLSRFATGTPSTIAISRTPTHPPSAGRYVRKNSPDVSR